MSGIFDCQNWFAAASTNFFYVQNLYSYSLKRVEVDLRGKHLRAALEVH